MYRRFGMYKDVVWAQLRLELKDIPYNPRQGLYSLYGLTLSFVFLAVGVQLILMLKTNPQGFWYGFIESNFSVPDTHLWDNFLEIIKRHNTYNLGVIAIILVGGGIVSAVFYLNRVVRFFRKK